MTVGSQLPFDRLVQAIDEIAPLLDLPVFAQTGRSKYVAKHIATEEVLAPLSFENQFRSARIVVAHAGIGTVLQARSFGKRLIVFPRRAALGEHRNDHQLATARGLQGTMGVRVAYDPDELAQHLRGANFEPPAPNTPSERQRALVAAISAMVADAI